MEKKQNQESQYIWDTRIVCAAISGELAQW